MIIGFSFCARGFTAEKKNVLQLVFAKLSKNKNKIFEKYLIKDIVFLAIITCCTLVTGAVMPLLVNVPMFGIIQLGLGLQFSIFPVIGLMKVKKPFALLLQSIFISVFLVFMFPPMVFLIVCAFVIELLTLLIFRGYKNDWACVFAATLYLSNLILDLPLLTLMASNFVIVLAVCGEIVGILFIFSASSSGEYLIICGVTLTPSFARADTADTICIIETEVPYP